MWERRPGDADFGHVRVGLGAQCLSTPLVTPELGPVEELDPVTSMELRRLIRNRSMVRDLPVALALRDSLRSQCAVTYPPPGTCFARWYVSWRSCTAPRSAGHAAVVDPLTAADWDWMKWLPHHQHPYAVDDGGPARMTYNSLVRGGGRRLRTGVGTHAVVLIDGGLITGGEGLFTSRWSLPV